MKTIFIGDAHIKDSSDTVQSSLCNFLTETFINNKEPQRLVIMGDLFDFWTGYKGIVYERYLPLLMVLKDIADSGSEICYVEGNHDFDIGYYFTDVLKAKVAADSLSLNLDGKNILLIHGDQADQSLGYRMLRGFFRSRFTKILKNILTPSQVMAIGMFLSGKSRGYSKQRGERTDNLLKDFAGTLLDDKTDAVVMGHSHKLGVTEIEGKGLYVNSGSWLNNEYIVFENGNFKEMTFEN